MPAYDISAIFAPVVIADGEEPGTAAYAASLAAAAGAALTVKAFAVKTEPPYSVASGFVGSLVGPINQRGREALDAAAAGLRRRHPDAELEARFLAHDDMLQAVGHAGRLHDLSVVEAAPVPLSPGRAVLEELLFHSGRPVIVAPRDAGPFKAERILVAWDGSACAARALGDAMFLVGRARHVVLPSAGEEKDLSQLPAAVDAAPRLARQGLSVEAVQLPGRDAGRALLDHAEAMGADLLVMGAYAHARWRQFILGGVTQTMLSAATRPVLMSH